MGPSTTARSLTAISGGDPFRPMSDPDRRFAVTSHPGEPDDLDLDHETFPFAGRFGRTRTGTAVVSVGDEVVAAIAFSPDRRDDTRCRVRHWAVRRDRQGVGHGPSIADRFADWALTTGYRSVAVGAETPYAAVALDRAGYAYAGERGPQGEVVFVRPASAPSHTLADALTALLDGDLPEAQRRYARTTRRNLEASDATDG